MTELWTPDRVEKAVSGMTNEQRDEFKALWQSIRPPAVEDKPRRHRKPAPVSPFTQGMDVFLSHKRYSGMVGVIKCFDQYDNYAWVEVYFDDSRTDLAKIPVKNMRQVDEPL